MLKEKDATKAEREAHVREVGYPAYVTSAGWLGYSDEKIARLTKEAVRAGFNHFKMKVGADRASDLRRGKIIRSIIDDPVHLPADIAPRDPNGPDLVGKNAGPTGGVLMIDANQVWDVPEAIDYVKSLEEIKPWFVIPYLFLLSRCADDATAGSSRSPPHPTTSWGMPRSAGRSSRTASASQPASMRTTAWFSSSCGKPRQSTSARSTRADSRV